jgi:hypothetical protein
MEKSVITNEKDDIMIGTYTLKNYENHPNPPILLRNPIRTEGLVPYQIKNKPTKKIAIEDCMP